MGIVETINLDRIKKQVNKDIEDEIMDRLQKMKGFAIKISPTKTGDFINSHFITPPKNEGGKIVGYLENNAPHGTILEYGVKGRKYKYHEGPPANDSTVIFEGVGNQTYKRTAEEFRK